MSNICFIPDDYINDNYESTTRWIVKLSDGRVVYQDDDRPGAEPPSAWKRLSLFLEQNQDIKIVGMTLGFRDNIINVGDNADGYFFVKSVLGCSSTLQTMPMVVVGTLRNGELRVNRYIVPEMLNVEEEIRDPLQAGEGLICQQSVMNNIRLNHQPQQTCIVLPLSILPS